MRKVLIDEALEVHAKTLELQDMGFISIDSCGIQMRVRDFVETFNKYEIKQFNVGGYIWKLVTEYNDVKFFTLLDAQEAEQYGIQIQK